MAQRSTPSPAADAGEPDPAASADGSPDAPATEPEAAPGAEGAPELEPAPDGAELPVTDPPAEAELSAEDAMAAFVAEHGEHEGFAHEGDAATGEQEAECPTCEAKLSIPAADPEASADAPAEPGSEPEADGDDEPRTYRARQALYSGKRGHIAAGELFVARPSSGLARSVFAEPVDESEVPEEVAAALQEAAAAAES